MINSISNNLITFKGDVNQASQNNIVAKSSSNSQNISKEKKNNKILHIPSARTLGTVFAGLGAILYAAGMGVKIYQYNKISIKSLTAELSKVFRRDLTENETKEIVSRYKELMKIDNAESFTKKAFEQIKKDYGYEKADIPLSIKYKNIWKTLLLHTNPFKKVRGGCFNSVNPSVEIVSLCTKKNKLNYIGKLTIINVLYHELKHMEQHHLCYLKDKDKYFKTLESVDSLKEIPDKLNELNKNYIRAFENVPNKDINKYSTIIDKLIKNNENYSVFPDVKYKEYKKQILEEEAFYAGKTGPKFRWLDKDSLLYPKGLIVYGLYVLIGASALSFAKDGYDTYKKTKI